MREDDDAVASSVECEEAERCGEGVVAGEAGVSMMRLWAVF